MTAEDSEQTWRDLALRMAASYYLLAFSKNEEERRDALDRWHADSKRVAALVAAEGNQVFRDA